MRIFVEESTCPFAKALEEVEVGDVSAAIDRGTDCKREFLWTRGSNHMESLQPILNQTSEFQGHLSKRVNTSHMKASHKSTQDILFWVL